MRWSAKIIRLTDHVMKQLLQNLKIGATEIIEVPLPAVGPGQVLIRTSRTLVSAGTERMLVDFGKAGWIEKARQQPEKVKQVLDKIRTDGLLPTMDAVFNKLDEPMPLGYCNAGKIIEVGGQRSEVGGLKPGDRVASNGPHADQVSCSYGPERLLMDSCQMTCFPSI